MAFTVTDFKTNLVAGGGGARPSLFKIDINSDHTGLSFSDSANILVKAASLPANNIAPLPVNYGGRAYKLNGFRTFDPWTTTVINDENMEVRQKIMEWMRILSGEFDGKRDAAHARTFMDGDATVTQVSVTGEDLHTYKFYNLWPTELAEVPLDWASDAIQEYTVTWAYDYWGHGDSFSAPTSIVDASKGADVTA